MTMTKTCVILLTTFSLFQFIAQELTPDSQCVNNPGSGRSLRISANSKRNQSGEWVDTFIARSEFSNSSDSVGLDVTHNFFECDGKRVIYIQGVSKDVSKDTSVERLTFHPRSGTNVEIFNNGRTVQKTNNDDPDNSVVFTNRPLKNNEIFQIRLDRKGTKFSHCLGFGIMTSTPTDVVIFAHFNHSPFAWMYYNNGIHHNNNEIKPNYGKNFNDLKVRIKTIALPDFMVGERVGVMRKQSGDLHFFINGVDQGLAVSGIPSSVYGVVELRNNAQQATVIEEKS